MTDRFQPSESLMWHMEADPLLRSTIVAAVFLDRSPDWEALVARLERASWLCPGFRQRVVETPLRVSTPRLVDVDIDLGFHVRRVVAPPPATRQTVLELARTEGMEAFDPARPLWRVTLVEGLDGGEAALLVKIHHALTDGVGGMQLAMYLYDTERDAAPPEPFTDEAHPAPVDANRLLLEALGDDARVLLDAARAAARSAAPALLHAAFHPGEVVRDVWATAASIARMVQPINETRSPVMVERSLRWRYDALDLPLAAMRAAARAVDGTLNDAFIAGVAGGLRRYHDKADAPVSSLRITLPISVRQEGDEPGRNKFTLMRFEIPVGETDPAERMRKVHALVARWRAERAIPHTQAVAAVLDRLPPSAIGGMLKHVDAVVSNVPGVSFPVYVAGSEVVAMYPFGPPAGAAINVTLLSYQRTCHIGVNMDLGAVSDPDAMLECLREGFDEVLAVGVGGAVDAGGAS